MAGRFKASGGAKSSGAARGGLDSNHNSNHDTAHTTPVPPPAMFAMRPENMPSENYSFTNMETPDEHAAPMPSANINTDTGSTKKRRKRKPSKAATTPSDGADLIREMDVKLVNIDTPAAAASAGPPDKKANRPRTPSADNLVEQRHLKECCEALGIPFRQSHLDFKEIPVFNDEGVFCDWPYRTLILYHNQGETLDSFKQALMRYEESYLLITGLLMTVGFGTTVSVHMTDYWDVWDIMTGDQVKEYDWMRMPSWDFAFKIVFVISALSSSLCSFKACTVFTSWFLAVSDTPADLVPVVITRYLVEYQHGRCAHSWPFNKVFGGVLPTDLLFSSLWYLCLAICCGITLLGGPVAGGFMTLTVLLWYKPIKEAGYNPYPVGVGQRGTYSTALQWAIDRNYHKV